MRSLGPLTRGSLHRGGYAIFLFLLFIVPFGLTSWMDLRSQVTGDVGEVGGWRQVADYVPPAPFPSLSSGVVNRPRLDIAAMPWMSRPQSGA